MTQSDTLTKIRTTDRYGNDLYLVLRGGAFLGSLWKWGSRWIPVLPDGDHGRPASVTVGVDFLTWITDLREARRQ